MDEEVKRRLDRLRSDLSALEGRTLTVQEVLAALVGRGERDRDAVLEELSGIHYPLPAARARQTLALAEDIGRTLYGGRSRRRY